MNALRRRFLVAACFTIVAATAATRTFAADAERPSDDVAAKAAVAAPWVLVLRDEAVRRELRLTAEQSAAVDKLLADVDYPLWYVRDNTGAETQVKCARAYDHLETGLAAALQPTQRARLDGLLLQAHGWPVVLVPRFADRLELTTEQRTKLRELLQPPTADAGKTQEVAKSADDQRRCKAVLTDEQNRRLAQILGAPSAVAKIRARPCRAPAVESIDAWINTEPLDWKRLEGKVVAVHFWAFGCSNCVHNLPHYQAWHEKFADRGLVVLGFHTPETQAERVADSVRAKVAEFQIKYPVAIDGGAKNWDAWATRWWPSVYLVDKRGYVRYWWYGELNWQGAQGEAYLRGKIEALLAEKD